jgi:hypothetical protein
MSDTNEGEDAYFSSSELFAMRKGRELLTALDEALDPFELFHCHTYSLPPRVVLQLHAICFPRAEMRFPPELAERANAVFDDFLAFSRWETSFERGHRLQDDWPLHRLLMQQTRHVIESFCCGHCDLVVEFYATKQRWVRLRKYARALGVVSFWVHMANRPGSAGYQAGLALLTNVVQ